MKIYPVKKARKDYPSFNIKKGDEYFFCYPKSAGVKRMMHTSRTGLLSWINNYARGFMGEMATNMEAWQERLVSITTQDEKDVILEEINDFLEQKQDNLSNIPDQLQESHIINEQIQELEDLIQEVEDIEVEDED